MFFVDNNSCDYKTQRILTLLIKSCYLTFKGHLQGRTVRWEFPTYPQEMTYTGQDNAWMNERVILLWAEQVLKLYVTEAPDGVILILLREWGGINSRTSVSSQTQH